MEYGKDEIFLELPCVIADSGYSDEQATHLYSTSQQLATLGINIIPIKKLRN